MTPDQVVENAVKAVKHKQFLMMLVHLKMPVDLTLTHVVMSVIDAGATTINIPFIWLQYATSVWSSD